MTDAAAALFAALIRDGSRREPRRGCSWEAIDELVTDGWAELVWRNNVEILRPTAMGRARLTREKTWPPM